MNCAATQKKCSSTLLFVLLVSRSARTLRTILVTSSKQKLEKLEENKHLSIFLCWAHHVTSVSCCCHGEPKPGPYAKCDSDKSRKHGFFAWLIGQAGIPAAVSRNRAFAPDP